MTGAFRERRFQPVPAHLRPRRFRRASRVIVTDGEATLLLADTDPGLPGTRWWVTPGGGIDPGETPLSAAVRELLEETGRRVAPADLLGPVAVRTVAHGYSDQILSQHETFFVLRTEQFEVSPAGLTAAERLTLTGWAWLPLAGLAGLPHPVWPANLPELVAVAGNRASWPLDLGEMEESTLGVC